MEHGMCRGSRRAQIQGAALSLPAPQGGSPIALRLGGLEGGGGSWGKWGFSAYGKVAYDGSASQARELAAAVCWRGGHTSGFRCKMRSEDGETRQSQFLIRLHKLPKGRVGSGGF
jgi:hypothetical protein